jgi:hypothetical protein
VESSNKELIKPKRVKAWTEERVRAVADYYDNQPEEEAIADIARFFSEDGAKSSESAKTKSRDGRYPKVTAPVAAKSMRASETRAAYGKGGSKGGSSKKGPKNK